MIDWWYSEAKITKSSRNGQRSTTILSIYSDLGNRLIELIWHQGAPTLIGFLIVSLILTRISQNPSNTTTPSWGVHVGPVISFFLVLVLGGVFIATEPSSDTQDTLKSSSATLADRNPKFQHKNCHKPPHPCADRFTCKIDNFKSLSSLWRDCR